MEKSYPTEHLTLRDFTLEDCPRVEEIINDFEVAKTTLSIPYPYPKGGAESFLNFCKESQAKGLSLNFSIVLKETNEVIGSIGSLISPEHKKAELGYWLGKAYWGKGYGTEAVKKMIEIGFKENDWNRISARAYTNNPASLRVMEKAGMKHEGTHRKELIKWGKTLDTAYYAILREEYEELEKTK